MKILLVDDHSLFLEGMQNLLRAGGYEVVGAVSDGLEALQMARKLLPDLILMDVRMPVCNGLEATRLIQAELPQIKIVMLTTSSEDTDLFEALKSGASGYLLKNLKPNVLFTYLEGLARGEAPLSRELSTRLLAEFARQAAAIEKPKPALEVAEPGDAAKSPTSADPVMEATPHPLDVELTPRQRQVLEMIAEGLSYKEAGAALHVSENTVKYHMGEILQRLHAKNREQVVSYALRSKWMRLQK